MVRTWGLGPQFRLILSARLLLAAILMVPAIALAAPGDILFSDNFERAALAPWTTSNPTVSGIATGPEVSGSPTRGVFTRSQAVTVTSTGFNAAVARAQLSIWVRRGSDAFSELPDVNEDLVIEYRRANNTWAQLTAYNGGGTPGEIFTDVFLLPPDALHSNLAIRARQTGGSGGNFDYWHFDDIVVTERAAPVVGLPLAVGVCDDFEGGLAANWTVLAAGGFAGVNTSTSQSPTNSMFLNGGVVEVRSGVVDTSDPTFTNLAVWIRRGADAFSEDPDNGENLIVEYLNNVGAWVQLETFAGGTGFGQIYARSYNLPSAGRHVNMQLRFRMTNGSGAGWDFWHVDDVCFDQALVPALVVAKNATVVSDPINGTTNSKAIPGAIIRYMLWVTNIGGGSADADTIQITDAISPNAALFVDTSGGDPIVFADGPTVSGLSYNYSVDVTFSNQVGGGPPYNYAPIPNVDGYDSAVTGLQIAPTGMMNAASGVSTPSFSITYEIRIP